MQIKLIDHVYSKIQKQDIPLVRDCVSYDRERWVRGRYHKEKVREPACMIKYGQILTGLIPRIEKYCKDRNIPLAYDRFDPSLPTSEPNLPGIIFRPDQNRLLKNVADHQRGVIKSPTGSGKTVLAGAICSMWPESNILFLCHTIDLLTNAYKDFQKWGLNNIIMLGGGSDKSIFDWQDGRQIIVSTIQTFSKYDLASYPDYFDIVIIDEVHHCVAKDSQYAKLLNQCLAPIRIGLTATPPDENKTKERFEALTLEGFLGPIIGEFSMDDAVKAGIIARPIINLLPVPYSDEIADLQGYKNIYQKGIVENRARNRLILTEAYKSIQEGESVLILVATTTEHGHILQKMAKDIFDIDIPFVYGATGTDMRWETLQALEEKKILCAIANVVWKEGVNVRSLGHVINGGGGQKERTTLQRIGRGQRATDTKKEVKITDFLDCYKYLDHHTILRLTTYAENGWLHGQ